MRCEFTNCNQWRGVKECHNNEGFFRLCKIHRKRANSEYIRREYKLTPLTILIDGQYRSVKE